MGSLGPLLLDLHERLAGVVVERLPYSDLIQRYDEPDVLFYLDPPYWGCEGGDYGRGVFERADFERLAKQLGAIVGNFVLSINDTPDAREVFAQFLIESPSPTLCTLHGSARKADELIVRICDKLIN